MLKTYTIVAWVTMAALVPAESLAYKAKFYNFAELAIDSDVIVIAGSLRTDGNELMMTVSEYVVGEGPDKLKASFKIPFRRRSPGVIEGTRLVFLREDEGGLRLFASDLQAIWPQTVPEGREYPFADFDRGVEALAGLCRQVRGFAHGTSPQEVCSALLDMLRSPDIFLQLTALQSGRHLRGLDPSKYADVARLGSAFALEMAGHADWRIRTASHSLVRSAPRTAALRSLLRLMSGAEVDERVQSEAFILFCSIAQESRWDVPFHERSRNPDRKLRAAAVVNMGTWLEENFSRLFAEDFGVIVRSLSSESMAMRTAGRLWLRAATGSDFGFDESGTSSQRAAALAKVQRWRQENPKP